MIAHSFPTIIHTHSRALFAIAYGVLQNREEAEDVVQDVLVKAWKTRWRVVYTGEIPGLAGYDRTRPHRARDLARRRRICSVPGGGSQTGRSAIRRGGRDFQKKRRSTNKVRAALATLPNLHRAALTLRYFEAMDYAAIERALGLSNGALRGILGRAMETMRKRLRPGLATLE